MDLALVVLIQVLYAIASLALVRNQGTQDPSACGADIRTHRESKHLVKANQSNTRKRGQSRRCHTTWLEENCDAHAENYENIIDFIFSILDNPPEGIQTISKNDIESVIDDTVYSDPNNLFVQLILYLYSMEGYIADSINELTRKNDFSEVDTLGPFSYALNQIL